MAGQWRRQTRNPDNTSTGSNVQAAVAEGFDALERVETLARKWANTRTGSTATSKRT